MAFPPEKNAQRPGKRKRTYDELNSNKEPTTKEKLEVTSSKESAKKNEIDGKQDTSQSVPAVAKAPRSGLEGMLPYAPKLEHYLAEGGTEKYQPRPEWYSSETRPSQQRPLDAAGILSDVEALSQKVTAATSTVEREAAIDELAVAISLQSARRSEANNETIGPTRKRTFGAAKDTALMTAIREGATEAALRLMELGADIHARNTKQATSLILACQKGNLVLCRELIAHGAKITDSSSTGSTPLLQASHFGHVDVVRFLLHNGANPEVSSVNDTTPLMRAAQEGHEKVVQVLLAYGADVNKSNNDNMSALMLASQRGHAKIVKILIDNKADIDAMTNLRSTSLMLACKRDHAAVVKVLLQEGCGLFQRDSRGRSAKDVAQGKGCKEVEKLLTPEKQVELLRFKYRRLRSLEIAKLWALLQQERALILLPDGTDQPIHAIPRDSFHLNVMGRSRAALLRCMTLPAPMVEHIASFLPLPHCWKEVLNLVLKRCCIDSNAAVDAALDVIDEALEEGGFVEACDTAGLVPPSGFQSWSEWRSYGKRHDEESKDGEEVSQASGSSRASVLKNTLPGLPRWEPGSTCWIPVGVKQPTTANEQRRGMCFLQLIARSPALAQILSAYPYNMPTWLIQQLMSVGDVQSLSRRLGSLSETKGVKFGGEWAVLLCMLWLAGHSNFVSCNVYGGGHACKQCVLLVQPREGGLSPNCKCSPEFTRDICKH